MLLSPLVFDGYIYSLFDRDIYAGLELKQQVLRKYCDFCQQMLYQCIVKRQAFRLGLNERLQFLDTALVFCLRYIVHHRLLPKLPQAQDFFCQIVVVLVTLGAVDQLTLKVFHSCVKVLNRIWIHLLDCKLKVLLQYPYISPPLKSVRII